MKIKGKALVLWLLVIVIACAVVTHIGGHLRFVLEHLVAFGVPMLRR
jgi:hypothetical protein